MAERRDRGRFIKGKCLGIKGSIAPKVELFSPASIVASESYLGNKGPFCVIKRWHRRQPINQSKFHYARGPFDRMSEYLGL